MSDAGIEEYPAIATRRIADFVVEAAEPVSIEGPRHLVERKLMSPYVWPEPDGTYRICIRAVPSQKPWPDTGLIWSGRGEDGLRFVMEPAPSLIGGPSEDDFGGVEDPSVHLRGDGSYLVYYTGLHADRRHGRLLVAEGGRLDALGKVGPALTFAPEDGSTKEASLYRAGERAWRLFYEFAEDHASRIGLAIAADPRGPWKAQPSPIQPREGLWDRWHLSTGPIVADPSGYPVMFYNGATEDGRWRIGWAVLDGDGSRVVDRCVQPLLTPPPVKDRSATDIAFAASAFERDGLIWLYYSLEDRRPMRALVRRIPGLNAN